MGHVNGKSITTIHFGILVNFFDYANNHNINFDWVELSMHSSNYNGYYKRENQILKSEWFSILCKTNTLINYLSLLSTRNLLLQMIILD